MPPAWLDFPHTLAVKVSEGRYYHARWIDYIARKVAATILRGNGRLIVNAPPQHGKSVFLTVWTPVWFLEHWPDHFVIEACAESTLALGFAGEVRNEFEHNPLLTTKLRQDSKAKDLWRTPAGGGMRAAGVGGQVYGFPAHLILGDDLVKNWEQATSRTFKDSLWTFLHTVLFNRLAPGGSIILMGTRWTDDDYFVQLQNENPGRWEVVSLPAIAGTEYDGPAGPDPLGRASGQPLMPERYSLADELSRRIDAGKVSWRAQHQQNPDTLGAGNLFSQFSTANVGTAPLRNDLALGLSLDFNINPGMHGLLLQHDPRADVIVFHDEIYGDRMDVRMLMKEFLAWLGAHGWRQGAMQPWPTIDIYGDATGESQWAGTSESCYDLVRQMLQAAGLRYRVRHLTGNPPIRESIDASNEALCDVLGRHHVLIASRCAGLIRDIRSMKTDISGTIDKSDNEIGHFCFPGDAPLDTPDGFRTLLACNVGDPIYTHLGIGTITDITCSGVKKLVKVWTPDNSRWIMSTATHPFRTDDGWRPIGGLHGRRLWERMWLERALPVEPSLLSTSIAKRQIAPVTARLLKSGCRVEPTEHMAPVYAVKTTDGSFYVRGILVSNCDAARYCTHYLRPLHRQVGAPVPGGRMG